jgi:peptide/nickel transport system permease protein
MLSSDSCNSSSGHLSNTGRSKHCFAEETPRHQNGRRVNNRSSQRPLAKYIFGSIVALSLLATMNALTNDVENRTNLARRFLPPTLSHPAGTDQFGRDVLSLVGAGAVSSLALAAALVAINTAAGTALALTGASGRVRRAILVSVSDTMLSIPTLIVAVVVAATIGSGTGALLLALGLVGWTPYFRLVLAQVDAAQQQQWVEAATATGASKGRVLVRHVLPVVSAPLISLTAARFGHAVVSVSSLSFLGVGPQPPSAEWGAVLASAQPHAERAPWVVVAPSVAIIATTSLAFVLGRAINGRHDFPSI